MTGGKDRKKAGGKNGKKPRYHTPPNVLREKCGQGGINPDVIQHAQQFIDDNPQDFTPYAESYIERLDAAIAEVRRDRSKRGLDVAQAIVRPVMELKANGAMFEYPLISAVAGVLLNFLEVISELNDDALDIVVVHRRTLGVIVASKLRGGGGHDGAALLQELADACDRYFRKYGPGEAATDEF